MIARQRGLVERPGGEVEAHAQPHQRQPEAAVVEMLPEEAFHDGWADREQAQRDRQREDGDGGDRQPHGAREGGMALGCLQSRQVWQQRRLDRLK